MSETETHDGGCLCGAVRYRIEGPIQSVVHCHCQMCRRSSGAPVSTWITVPVEAFKVTKGAPATYHSSDHGRRGFCPTCGGQLTFFSTERPEELDVTLGTLDDPAGLTAQYHIWTSSRLPAFRIDEHVPVRKGQTEGG